MNDADFRRQLEEAATHTHADSTKDFSRLFDGLSAARVPFVRTEVWKPAGRDLLLAVDRDEMQGKVTEIIKFLLLAG